MPNKGFRQSSSFLFLVFLSLSSAAHAEGQLVIGRITDTMTDDPVRDAEITLFTHERVVVARGISNARGQYAIRLKEHGLFLLTVSRMGYATGDTLSVVVPEDNTAYLDLDLTPEGIELPGILVVASKLSVSLARRGFYDRQRKGLGEFIDAEDIKKQPGRRITDLLRRVPGIRVNGNIPYVTRAQGLSLDAAAGTAGGLRGCQPTLLLDGMVLRGNGEFDLIPLEWVMGVEVYKGSATIPAQWRHLASCGLIAVWTG